MVGSPEIAAQDPTFFNSLRLASFTVISLRNDHRILHRRLRLLSRARALHPHAAGVHRGVCGVDCGRHEGRSCRHRTQGASIDDRAGASSLGGPLPEDGQKQNRRQHQDRGPFDPAGQSFLPRARAPRWCRSSKARNSISRPRSASPSRASSTSARAWPVPVPPKPIHGCSRPPNGCFPA